MRTITLEEHFFADGFREAAQRNNRGGQGQGRNAGYMATVEEKLVDLGSIRLHDMDAGGIDLQVISHTASGIAQLAGEESIRLSRAANDQLAAAVAAHPERFAGFATLPMTEPEAAADEFERAVCDLGFKGAMINGTTNGRFLDDPMFLPILERAVALGVPIYLHPAEPQAVVKEAYYTGFTPEINFALSTAAWGWHSETGIHALRMILAGVFDRLPNLQIIIGHMGKMIPFMLARTDTVITRSASGHLHRPFPEYFLNNFYITTSGFFTDPPLLLALQVVGADRILFSIDYPYSSNEQGRAFLDAAPISPADKEKISHLNAEKVLKLATSQHG